MLRYFDSLSINAMEFPIKHPDKYQLTEKYDVLNEQFVLVENRLRALRPMRPVWVSCSNTDEAGTEDGGLLWIAKLGNKWRLVYTDSKSEPKPITECPALVRCRAAKYVRCLHAEIIKQKELIIPEIEDAITELTRYLAEGDE